MQTQQLEPASVPWQPRLPGTLVQDPAGTSRQEHWSALVQGDVMRTHDPAGPEQLAADPAPL
jgi:hypothetical protein